MDINVESLSAFEAAVSHSIRLVGTCIEVFGVFIIVAGIVWSTYHSARQRVDERHYDQYKIRIGRSLLLGPERVNDFETPFVMRLASERV